MNLNDFLNIFLLVRKYDGEETKQTELFSL